MPIYIIGTKFKTKILEFAKEKWFKYLWMGAGIIPAVIMLFNGRVSINMAWYGDGCADLTLMKMICFYVSSMSGIFAVLSLSSIIRNGFLLLKTAADSLITIMCIQYLFIEVINNYYQSSSVFAILVKAIIVMLLCIVSHLIISKYAPFMIGKIGTAVHEQTKE